MTKTKEAILSPKHEHGLIHENNKDDPRDLKEGDHDSKEETQRNSNKKDRVNQGDVYSRWNSSSTSGRGMLSGWAKCPLCPEKSQKRYSCGRGMAAHLHAVHTPWNPSPSEIRRKRRLLVRALAEKNKNKQKHKQNKNDESNGRLSDIHDKQSMAKRWTWTPTAAEVQAWAQKVEQLTAQADATSTCLVSSIATTNTKKRKRPVQEEDASTQTAISNTTTTQHTLPQVIPSGHDRKGQKASSYRDSLPPFLSHAADGYLDKLKAMVDQYHKNRITAKTKQANNNDTPKPPWQITDRNGSTAEHWAAGGGHTEALAFLLSLQTHPSPQHDTNHNNPPPRRQRRRDGKTALHWAARNAHLPCIHLLLHSTPSIPIDQPSGDGTTPLHLACYSGHFPTIQSLLQTYHANVHAVNAWGCGVAHWLAMSIAHHDVSEVCQYLYQEWGVEFCGKQKQGHSPLHKAAQKGREDVIVWMLSGVVAGEEEEGVVLPEFRKRPRLLEVCQNKKEVKQNDKVGDKDLVLHREWKEKKKKEKECSEQMQQAEEPPTSLSSNPKKSRQCMAKEEIIKAAGPDQNGHLPSDIYIMALGGQETPFSQWMKNHGC